jgi:hypothetical protein
VNVDTDTMQAISDDMDALVDQVAGQRRDTDRLVGLLCELLDLTTPVLRAALDRGRDHNARSASIHHTGRHRRYRHPPRCGDDS